MPGIERRYSQEETAQRGDAIYEERIRPILKPQDRGRIVAIDIETGDYEIADQVILAGDKLHSRNPNAQTWFVRVGFRHVYRFGGGVRVESDE